MTRFMRSISGVLVGEVKEIECFRPRKVDRLVTLPLPEGIGRRLIRRLLRRPQPTIERNWPATEWDKVGPTIWVIGTDNGPEVRYEEPK